MWVTCPDCGAHLAQVDGRQIIMRLSVRRNGRRRRRMMRAYDMADFECEGCGCVFVYIVAEHRPPAIMDPWPNEELESHE